MIVQDVMQWSRDRVSVSQPRLCRFNDHSVHCKQSWANWLSSVCDQPNLTSYPQRHCKWVLGGCSALSGPRKQPVSPTIRGRVPQVV